MAVGVAVLVGVLVIVGVRVGVEVTVAVGVVVGVKVASLRMIGRKTCGVADCDSAPFAWISNAARITMVNPAIRGMRRLMFIKKTVVDVYWSITPRKRGAGLVKIFNGDIAPKYSLFVKVCKTVKNGERRI